MPPAVHSTQKIECRFIVRHHAKRFGRIDSNYLRLDESDTMRWSLQRDIGKATGFHYFIEAEVFADLVEKESRRNSRIEILEVLEHKGCGIC